MKFDFNSRTMWSVDELVDIIGFDLSEIIKRGDICLGQSFWDWIGQFVFHDLNQKILEFAIKRTHGWRYCWGSSSSMLNSTETE